MFRSIQLFLVFVIIISHNINGQQDPEALWNMREKDRLIKHISRSEEYRGFYYENYKWILHELIPKGKNKYHYRKISGPFMESSECVFTGTDPQKIVQDIMKSYTGEAEECNKPDRAEFHEKLAEQKSYIEPMNFRLLGSMDNRWVGLVSYRKMKDETNLPDNFFRMHYVNKNGIKEEVEETIYYDSLRPIAVSGRYKLMLDRANKIITINLKNRSITLPDHVNRYLLEWSERSYLQKGNAAPFIFHDSELYGFVLPKNNDDPFELYNISLEDGKYEKLYDNALSPRIEDDQLYFFRMMAQRNNTKEIDIKKSGLFKVGLKGNDSSHVISAGVSEFINFQAMYYVPDENGNKIVYQILESLGDDSQTAIFEPQMIRNAGISEVESAESTLRELKETFEKEMSEISYDFDYVKFSFSPSSDDSAYIKEEVNFLKEQFSEAENGKEFARRQSSNNNYHAQLSLEELPDKMRTQAADLETGKVYGPYIIDGGYIIFKILNIIDEKNYEVAWIYREIVPSNESIESAYIQAGKISDNVTDINTFLKVAEKNNLEIYEARGVGNGTQSINDLEDMYEINNWLSEGPSNGEVSDLIYTGTEIIIAVITNIYGDISHAHQLEEEIDKTRDELEIQYEELESVIQKAVSRALVPGNYVLIPDPVNGEPIFVSGNPYWPVLDMEDVLELE